MGEKGANHSETYSSSWGQEQNLEKLNFFAKQLPEIGKETRSSGEETGMSAIDHREPVAPPLPFLSPSSLHLLLSFQQTGRQLEQSHSNPTPHCCHAEREARRSSLTAAGFEGHLKNTTRQKQRQAPFSDHAREPEPSHDNSTSLSLSLSLARSPSLSLSQSPHPPSPSSTQQLNQ